MLARLIVGGSASMLLLALFAAAIWWPAARDREPHPSWTVTKKTVVHGVMIVDVVAGGESGTDAIVASIVTAQVSRTFDEVLIYVRTHSTATAARRVQWTPGGGYRELLIP